MAKNDNLKDFLTDVANAIREKKGITNLINPQDFSSEIASIKTGGGGAVVSSGAVTFYDYDGVVLHSYTKDEFLALSAMPELPEREGLICQEWNWSFEDAVAYVQEYGVLDVGATYITDDGKTRLYIKIAAKGRMDVPLYFSQTVANGVVIDWGDGSETETLGGMWNVNTTHKYAEIGDYVITLAPIEGCTLGLGHNSSTYSVMGSTSNVGRAYCNMLQKVEIGRYVTSIGVGAFGLCTSLTSVVIPNSVTSITSTVFRSCYSIISVIIPNSVKSIGDSAFSTCSSLASVVLPKSVTSIGSKAFEKCNFLSSVVIPNSVTSIGGQVFSTCNSLASVVLPKSVTSIGTYIFNSCYSLASIVIPNSVTTIGDSMFNSCYCLASIVIPNSVTSIQKSAFSYCSSLVSVFFSNSITNIGKQAFYYNASIAVCDFSTHTAVPTLSEKDAFDNNPSDFKIIVPDALYDEWIAATNWSAYASKIIKKTDWDASQA